ncbi:MAG: hypothetical protein CFH32_01114 [Alphaproteobacteria bacterium MarineAlpha9_Bin2]|nr:MAG: hypothetical protein CFH32_01114 [Alphaproteobacteria bacterium MarineAlpha9_Bin2]
MHNTLKNTVEKYIKNNSSLTVAVSGGVDSVTLSVFLSNKINCYRLNVAHAISSAVPREATKRVKSLAKKYNWNLHILNAGELQDPKYISNPINRCYYCKTNLYSSISKTIPGQIFSGANLDDLKDFRPGLEAAKNSSVIHPFIEAKMDKKAVRKLAMKLGLSAISELPSSPCLSSRIQTGINITSDLLKKIDEVEIKIRNIIPNSDVRCRWLKKGVVIEFNEPNIDKLENIYKSQIISFTGKTFELSKEFISIKKYKKGSAFIGKKEGVTNG